MTFSNIMLKTIPYLLSIVGGVLVFHFGVIKMHDTNMAGLMSNMAASLLAIPLVFLLYDYSNYLVSRRVNKTLTNGMIFKINSLMLKILVLCRNIAGTKQKITWDDIDNILNGRVIISRSKIDMSQTNLDLLRSYRDTLDTWLYRTDKIQVLHPQQIETLSSMNIAMTQLLNEHRLRGSDIQYKKYLENMMIFMGNWFLSIGPNMLRVHQTFRLLIKN